MRHTIQKPKPKNNPHPPLPQNHMMHRQKTIDTISKINTASFRKFHQNTSHKVIIYAYWRIHANSQIASTCIANVGILAFLYLRLNFGTTPAPAKYTTIIEVAIDLGNNIFIDTPWDTTDLQSPHGNLLPREDYQSTSYPIVQVDILAVDVEAK